jgi:hypothetical protein
MQEGVHNGQRLPAVLSREEVLLARQQHCNEEASGLVVRAVADGFMRTRPSGRVASACTATMHR